MLELTAAAEVNGQKFDGVDLFLFHPHTDPDASDDELKAMADKIAAKGLASARSSPRSGRARSAARPWAATKTARTSCSP
jgi:hypothetical protein